MILIDANVLLYAYDAGSPFHDQARNWLEETLAARNGQVSGPDIMDAHLAALAPSGATLCTTDKGFARFDGLKRLNPLTERR